MKDDTFRVTLVPASMSRMTVGDEQWLYGLGPMRTSHVDYTTGEVEMVPIRGVRGWWLRTKRRLRRAWRR